MDNLEFVSFGVRQVEDESAVGAGLRLDPARAMEDDRTGDRILTRAHHLAPDLRGPGGRGEKQEERKDRQRRLETHGIHLYLF